MPFDYKKEYKEFYLPPKTPELVTVPAMDFLAVRGTGDPNQEDGAYKQAIGLLYAVAYTIKMSKKGGHELEGYFDYVVSPLEGLWWQEGVYGSRLFPQAGLPVDFPDSAAGVRHPGGIRLGDSGSHGKEAAGFFSGGVLSLGGRPLRAVHAHRAL